MKIYIRNKFEPFRSIPTSLLLVLLLLLSPVVLAENVDETKPVDDDGLVTIKVVRGLVDVIGWDESQVRVVGTLDEDLEEFIFEVEDDHTHIEVKIEDKNAGNWYERNRGSELSVYVPQMSEVEVGGVSTDVSVNGVDGEVGISVVSGEVQVGAGEGDVELNAVSGNIDVAGRAGDVQASSFSGDIVASDNGGSGEFGSVSGDLIVRNAGLALELSTISGDIEVVTGNVDTAEGQSVSGDIDLEVDVEDADNIELESISGNIDLRLGGDIDARFALETGSGRIKNRVTDDEPDVSRFVRDESLRFTIGDGDTQIELSSQSGDLTVGPR